METGTSAVGEAGRDKPTLGMTDVGGTTEGLEGKYRSNVEEEEGEGGVLHHGPCRVLGRKKRKRTL